MVQYPDAPVVALGDGYVGVMAAQRRLALRCGARARIYRAHCDSRWR